MAAELFTPPSKALDANANPYSGAKWFFYESTTTTPLSVFTTAALNVAHTNPVVADSSGKFPNIFFNSSLAYRGILKNADESVTLYDIDPVNASILLALGLGTGASLVGVKKRFPSSEARNMSLDGNSRVHIFDWLTDGEQASVLARTISNDYSAKINAAIDEVSADGGGTIIMPSGGAVAADIILKTGVSLRAENVTHGDASTAVSPFRLAGVGGAWVVDTPATLVNSVGIEGITITGPVTGSTGGIRLRNVNRSTIRCVNLNNFENQGILLEQGIENLIDMAFATRCLLTRSRAQRDGVVQLGALATDNWLQNIEATPSTTSVTDVNLRCAAFAVYGTNNFIGAGQAEIADIGFYLGPSANYNRISQIRADLNYGHGFYNDGANNQISNCLALNNSRDATNTYDGFFASSTASNNQYTNVRSASDSAVAQDHRYGIRDEYTGDQKNRYSNTLSTGAATADYANVEDGSAFDFPRGSRVGLTVNSATPSVSGQAYVFTQNSSATTITDFSGGVNGQEVLVDCLDANTTVQHNGATTTLPGGVNMLLQNNFSYRFVRNNGLWSLKDRSPGPVAAKINDPSGGVTVDTESRAAINAIIDALEANGVSLP